MRAYLLTLLIVVTGCGSQPQKESYGLKTIEIRMESTALSQLNSSYNDKTTFPATVSIEGIDHSARVNYAGRTTLDAWKKSWDIHLDNKTWRLAATPDDPTMLRSVAGYKLFALVGFHVPDTEFVYVYLNDEPAGLFLRKELVSGDFFEKRDVPIRSLYKAHYNDKNIDERTITLVSEFFSAKYHRNEFGGEKKNWSDLKQLLREMVYPSGTISRIDHDSLYRYHAATIALSNWDGFANNYLLYNRTDDNSNFFFQPWDLDRAFEADSEIHGTIGDDFWGTYISADPVRSAAYTQILAATVNLLASEDFLAYLHDQAGLIEAAWSADRALGGHGENFPRQYQDLTEKIRARAAFLSSQISTFVP